MPTDPLDPTPATRSWPRRLLARLWANPIVMVVLVLGLIAGPMTAGYLVPDVSLTKRIFGGAIVGFYFALCAAPEQFLDL